MLVLNNIGTNGMPLNRGKLNSTMMVKFNSNTEKNIGMQQRVNLNKSTLLPQNINNHQSTVGSNSRNPQIKQAGNPGETGSQIDQNMQHSSLEHLNRSLNMHQTPFSHNQSYQQSPPNMRAKQVVQGQKQINMKHSNSKAS
jgi:hypothetical protein